MFINSFYISNDRSRCIKGKKIVRINYIFKSKYTRTEITQINVVCAS